MTTIIIFIEEILQKKKKNLEKKKLLDRASVEHIFIWIFSTARVNEMTQMWLKPAGEFTVSISNTQSWGRLHMQCILRSQMVLQEPGL